MRKILYITLFFLLVASSAHAQVFGGSPAGSVTGMASDGSVAWTGAPVPDSAGGQTIGTTSAEWGHIYLHNSKSIYFQADQSLYLTGGAGVLTLTGGNFVPGAATLTLGSATAEWGGLYLGDAKSIYFQADQSVYLTSGAGTLTLSGGNLALGANSLTMTGSIAATGNRVTKGWFTDIESTNAPTVGGTAYKPADLAIASQAGGDILYFNGTNWVRLAKDEGKYLKSGAAAVSWDSPAGSGDVESVGDCTSGACLDGSSDGGTYIRLYDGNSHYTGILAGDSTANLSFYFPTTAGAQGGLLYYSGANQMANLGIGTANQVLQTNSGATAPEWTSSLTISSIAMGTGYISFGSDPADAGALRFSNADKLMWEASAAGTDVEALSVDSAEVVQIGAAGASGVTITPKTTFGDDAILHSSDENPAATAGSIKHDSSSTEASTTNLGVLKWHDGTNVRTVIDTGAAYTKITKAEYIPIRYAEDDDSVTAPAAAAEIGTTGLIARSFAEDADNGVLFFWQVPFDFVSGIKYRVYYAVDTNASADETVAFGLSGCSVGNSDAIACTEGTAVNVTDELTTDEDTGELIVTGWSTEVTVTDIAAGEIAKLLFIRDVSEDDTAGHTLVVGIEIKYVGRLNPFSDY